MQNLIYLIDEEYILKMPLFTKIDDEDDVLDKNPLQLNQVMFDLTQKCNLRCKYCIYNDYNGEFRNFTNADMSWDTLKSGLDYVKQHSGKKVTIVFYGGEPLLKFDIIKKAIEYYTSIQDANQEVIYTMTTNMTLITKDIANFLADIKDMRIVCSFDGPEDIQNKFRVFENKKGTFDSSLTGLKFLSEAFKDKKKNSLSINMVLCPPYNEKNLMN